jgi:hypothetical protein
VKDGSLGEGGKRAKAKYQPIDKPDLEGVGFENGTECMTGVRKRDFDYDLLCGDRGHPAGDGRAGIRSRAGGRSAVSKD